MIQGSQAMKDKVLLLAQSAVNLYNVSMKRNNNKEYSVKKIEQKIKTNIINKLITDYRLVSPKCEIKLAIENDILKVKSVTV